VAQRVEVQAGDEIGGAQGATEMTAVANADGLDHEAAQFATLAGEFEVEWYHGEEGLGLGWLGR
jgi:hypothetical protein